MVDKHGGGQVEMCRANQLGAVKDGRESWTKEQRWPED
jgi:hypothetical protein